MFAVNKRHVNTQTRIKVIRNNADYRKHDIHEMLFKLNEIVMPFKTLQRKCCFYQFLTINGSMVSFRMAK